MLILIKAPKITWGLMLRGGRFHRLSDLGLLTLLFAYSNFFSPLAYSKPLSVDGLNTTSEISLRAIALIESSNKPHAVGDNGRALGLFQIHSVVVREFNNFHKNHYTHKDMLDPAKAEIVARWYISERIPAMLRHYRKEESVKNIIWAYNAGIGSVLKGIIPPITQQYLDKYRRLTNAAL